jgi:hypothetical protein
MLGVDDDEEAADPATDETRRPACYTQTDQYRC